MRKLVPGLPCRVACRFARGRRRPRRAAGAGGRRPAAGDPEGRKTSAGSTWAIANQIAELIAKDLRWSGRFLPVDVKSIRSPSYPEVTAPDYATVARRRRPRLVSGFVQARSDGRLTVGCYLYDVRAGARARPARAS